MAATDYKITTADIDGVHVEAQPTILKGSALQNKQVFDAYPDMIVRKHNSLCDYVENEISHNPLVDVSVIAFYASIGCVFE